MEEAYWNKYYSQATKRAAPAIPSQFAAFVATEFKQDAPLIVDLGCGNGRDTRFFAHSGFSAVGIDASREAISGCQAMAADSEGLSFMCASLDDSSVPSEVNALASEKPVLLYARFFLHAISDADECQFFELAKSICGARGTIAVEFRTDKDEALSKVTDTHYRRFINPVSFVERAHAKGYSTRYFVEGFGYAKFKNDDAHVARVLLNPIKRNP